MVVPSGAAGRRTFRWAESMRPTRGFTTSPAIHSLNLSVHTCRTPGRPSQALRQHTSAAVDRAPGTSRSHDQWCTQHNGAVRAVVTETSPPCMTYGDH